MNKIIGKPTELKNVNTSLIISSIRSRGNATRSEISKDTGLSHTTVRAILKELMDMDEIVSLGLDESTGGRRASRYEINLNKRFLLVMAIEKYNVNYRVVNTLGNTIEENSRGITSLEDVNVVIELIESLEGIYKNIEGIGISVPGVVTDDGFLSGIRMEDWKEIKIKKQIEEKFNIPILLENDINSSAIAFYNDYVEKNNNRKMSLVYISFTSLGVGSGIVVNGKVIKGDNGYAGEIGFIPMGDSFFNTKISSELDDLEYCCVVIDAIKVISAIINPSVVVLGGINFRYYLKDTIIEKYNKEFNIKTKILIQEKNNNYSMEGITEKALCLINKEFKLIRS
ncbi:ROK family transcriptional regulator [Clostridium sp.]|uniref:ROK family transcriptional regulator n=1 Tax=Clostridium sp. TaxID=1506 RepID=UPI0025BAD0BD|nr:ROK family transcriptional regulator [Clostridium sp.]